MRRLLCIAFLTMSCFLPASELLKNLDDVSILVGQLDSRLETAGLSKENLMEVVNGRLMNAGMDTSWEPGKPFLNVRIRAMSLNTTNIVCHIQVALHELASLKRNLSWISATTWSQSSLLVVPLQESPSQIRRIVGEMTEQFVSDYRKSNM